MNKHRTTQTIGILICIIAILFSMIYLAPKMGAPQTYEKTIMSLDKKAKGVVELSALTVGVSSAITALPGDTGTTVADHLMDLNSGLFIVMIAFYWLQQFLPEYILQTKSKIFIIFHWKIPSKRLKISKKKPKMQQMMQPKRIPILLLVLFLKLRMPFQMLLPESSIKERLF